MMAQMAATLVTSVTTAAFMPSSWTVLEGPSKRGIQPVKSLLNTPTRTRGRMALGLVAAIG